MSSPIEDTPKTRAVMHELRDVLLRHFGILPDAVLVLRDGECCRTVFGANPDNYRKGEDPRAVMTAMMESAALENREVIRAIRKREGR